MAAIAVVLFHFSSRLDLPSLFAHGYLGVDFFFVLSGFVIAHAYGTRLAMGTMSFRSFFVLRVIRLLPMVVFGTLIAAVIDLLRPGDFSMARHLADIGVAILMGCLCLPTLWHTTLEPTVFPLNSPVWSLFFELVANFACVPLYRSRQPERLIALVTVVSLVALAWGTIATDAVNLGSVPGDFWLGFPRVGWSFSLGILLSGVKVRVPPVSKWIYAAALCAVMACPTLPDGWNGLFDLLAVVVVFPLIVLGAAHCRGAERQSSLSAWSGNVSYPLYATHYPLVRAVGLVGRRVTDSVAGHLLIALVGMVAMVAFSARSTIRCARPPPGSRRASGPGGSMPAPPGHYHNGVNAGAHLWGGEHATIHRPFRLARTEDHGREGCGGLLLRRRRLDRTEFGRGWHRIYPPHGRADAGCGADDASARSEGRGRANRLDRLYRRRRCGCRCRPRHPGRRRLSAFDGYSGHRPARQRRRSAGRRVRPVPAASPMEGSPPPVGTPGTAGWHELRASDAPRVFDFYAGLFGWEKADAIDMGPMGIYQLFTVGGVAVGGMMTNPQPEGPPSWLYYFNVAEIDAAAARVARAGGQVTAGPHEVPGGMWITQGLDPQGSRFALVAPPA